MSSGGLTKEEQQFLLRLARETIEKAVKGEKLAPIDLEQVPEGLRQPGATFVTLTKNGELRGCIGILEAYQSIAEDVRDHALAAAFEDYRFPPVTADELDQLSIEISYLSEPKPLVYQHANELLEKLRPGIDGVVIKDGNRRATFLPQVWESLPDPVDFLDHLCLKLGAPRNLWRVKKLEVLTYQVQEFHEPSWSRRSS